MCMCVFGEVRTEIFVFAASPFTNFCLISQSFLQHPRVLRKHERKQKTSESAPGPTSCRSELSFKNLVLGKFCRSFWNSFFRKRIQLDVPKSTHFLTFWTFLMNSQMIPSNRREILDIMPNNFPDFYFQKSFSSTPNVSFIFFQCFEVK